MPILFGREDAAFMKKSFFARIKVSPSFRGGSRFLQFSAVFLMVFFAYKAINFLLPQTQYTLSVNYSTQQQGKIQWVQNNSAQEKQLPAAKDGSVDFEVVPGPLAELRVDFELPMAAKFQLHSLQIQDLHSELKLTFDAPAILTANLNDLERSDNGDLIVSGQDPHVVIVGPIQVQSKSGAWKSLQNSRDNLTVFKVYSLLLGLSALFLFHNHFWLAFAASTWLLFQYQVWQFLAQYFQKYPKFLGTDKVISWASYVGYAKVSERLLYLSGLASFLIWGFLTAWFARDRFLPSEAAENDRRQPSRKILWIAFTLCAFFLFLPDLEKVIDAIRNFIHPDYWDYLNFQVWAWAQWKGWIPLRDFWYPYAGQIFFNRPLPHQTLIFSAHLSLTHSILAYCFFRISNRNWWISLLLSFLILIASQWAWLSQPARYLFFSVACFYGLVILGEKSRTRFELMFLAIFWNWIFFFESNALIYVALPFLFCWSLDFFLKKESLKSKFSEWLPFISLASIGLLFQLLWITVNGQIAGWWQTYSQIDGLTANAAISTDFLRWVAESDQVQGWVLFSIGLALVLGPHFFLSRLANQSRQYALLGLGLCSALIYMKHLNRPHMVLQVANSTVVIWAIYFLLLDRYKIQRIFAAIAVSVAVLAMNNKGADLTWYKVFFSERMHALKSWSNYQLQLAQAAERDYYDIKKYPIPSDLDLDFWQKIQSLGRQAEFYSLGDWSFLYRHLDQKPFYFLTVFDGGLVDFQEKTIQELEARLPKFVFVSMVTRAVDEVPIALRYALVFQYITKNYTLAFKTGNYAVLQRNDLNLSSGAPSAKVENKKFWIDYLGDQLELGCLPYLAREKIFQPTDSQNAKLFSITDEQARSGIKFSTEFGEILVKASCGLQSDAVLRLDRLWFFAQIRDGLPKELNKAFLLPEEMLHLMY